MLFWCRGSGFCVSPGQKKIPVNVTELQRRHGASPEIIFLFELAFYGVSTREHTWTQPRRSVLLSAAAGSDERWGRRSRGAYGELCERLRLDNRCKRLQVQHSSPLSGWCWHKRSPRFICGEMSVSQYIRVKNWWIKLKIFEVCSPTQLTGSQYAVITDGLCLFIDNNAFLGKPSLQPCFSVNEWACYIILSPKYSAFIVFCCRCLYPKLVVNYHGRSFIYDLQWPTFFIFDGMYF